MVSTRNTGVLFCKAAFQPVIPLHAVMPGVVPPQVQDFALPLVDMHEVPVRLFLQLVEGPFGWQHNPLACWPLLPVLCHQLTC